MLSRVAESIFWMSRCIERAENVARFIDVNQRLSLGVNDDANLQWAPLVYTTGGEQLFFELYGPDAAFVRDRVLRFLISETGNPNSILSCLTNARQNARGVRENLTTPMWEEINRFYLLVREAATKPGTLRRPDEFLTAVKRASHLIWGVTDSTMSRGEAWHFCRMGRLLERADKTSRILDVKYYILLPQPQDVGMPYDVVQWSALLESTSALQMYRRRFGRIVPIHVAEFLILDRLFLRSLHYGVLGAEASLHAITGTAGGAYTNCSEQKLGMLKADLDCAHIDDIVSQGMHQFIDAFQIRLNEVGDAVHECFFSPETVHLPSP